MLGRPAVLAVLSLVLLSFLTTSFGNRLQARPSRWLLENSHRWLVEEPNAEQCLTSRLRTVVDKCAAGSNTNDTAGDSVQNVRDAVISLIQTCVKDDSAYNNSEGIRILTPGGYIANLINDLTDVYRRTTGIPVKLVSPPFSSYVQARLNSLQNPDNQSITHEAWLITPSGLGDGIKAFMDLSSLVLYDDQLQWPGILPLVRSVGLVYDSKVISLPLSSHAYQLMYRQDTFAAHNWTVPRTWKELVDLAWRINGTNNSYGFCGLWGPCGSLGTNVLKLIMASYHQTHGATQGWLLDPDSMTLLMDSPAMAETIDIVKALYRVSPPDDSLQYGCTTGQGLSFAQGVCHMTITFGILFKYMSHQSNAGGKMYGNLGVAPLPGSPRVLDRTTNTLVPCNDKRCPYAVRDTTSGTDRWINYSPGFEATLIPINGHTDPTMRFYTYSVISYLARPDVSDGFVFNPQAEVLPIRTSQMLPQRWAAYGYHLGDATRYSNSMSAALNHPNLHVQIRIPGASNFVSLFGNIMSDIMNTNKSTAAIVAPLQATGWDILNTTFNGNSTALKLEYWSSINKPQVPPPPTIVPTTTPDPSPPPIDSSSNSNQTLIVLLCVLIPSCLVLIVAAVIVRKFWMGGTGGSTRNPPGVGPRTTLLVSDIESSTVLWEELDAAVMDASVKLHNACIRTLAAEHKGYESLWEGDSFIIAFWDPVDAINFAAHAQLQLLHVDWNPRLLRNPCTAEVWVAERRKQLPKPANKSHTTLNPIYCDAANVRSKLSEAAISEPSQEKMATISIMDSFDQGGEIRVFDSGAPGPAHRHSDSTMSVALTVPTQGVHYDSGTNLLPSRSLTPYSDNGRPSTFQTQMHTEWQIVPAGMPGAVLVYRGLRVRFGFACGLAHETDKNYNIASGRWVYTGQIRIMANAVASAGLGGHITISRTTAALLGKDVNGVLKHLPQDVRAYHMGDHILNGMGDTPIPLLLLLHRTLKPRLALMQQNLRTQKCVNPGVLSAPAPSSTGFMPVLAGLKLDGLASLMAWNAKEATFAICQLVDAINEELKQWRGTMSEDGISIAAEPNLLPDTLLTGGKAARDAVCHGRVVAAFGDAFDAVHFAVSLRQRLLTLDWSETLLSHELCEQVGVMTDLDDFGIHHAKFEERGSGGAPRIALANNSPARSINIGVPATQRSPNNRTSTDVKDRESSQGLRDNVYLPRDSPYQTRDSPPSVDGEQRRISRFGVAPATVKSKVSFANAVSPAPMPMISPAIALPLPSEPTAGSDRLAARMLDFERSASATNMLRLDGRSLSVSERLRKEHVLRPVPSGADTDPGIAATAAVSKLVALTPASMAHSVSTNPGSARADRLQIRKSESMMSVPQLDKQDKGTAMDDLTMHVSDAPCLVGPRVRMAITTGLTTLHIATRGSGRVVYHGCKNHKLLLKMLQQARAGQVMVSGSVMQQIHMLNHRNGDF